ncbi:MAG: O-antigen ligase family protein [Pleurocapsa sp. MO_192.B19]|nr:O-antigen ligase family protein [Pleurocapsa sp. MO_192.B19]
MISVLILPLFPAMGTGGLLIVLIRVWQCRYGQIIKNRFNWWLAIVGGLLIISSALAHQPQEAWLGLANFLPFFLLFIALKIIIKHPRQLQQLSWFLILPSLPIVLLGFGQLFAAWDTPPLLESILGWQLVPQGIPPGRMSAVFIYTNFLAIYLAIALTLALGLWLENWQTWRRKSTQQLTWTLLLLTLILLADISGLILTSSRNAWGLALISFLAYALYMGWRWLVWSVAGATTTILWASFAPNLGGEQLRKIVPAFFWARLSDQMYPDRPIETLRITQWQFCWDLIQERPLLGWGLRNFTPLYEAKMNFWFGHPHNLFLMLSAETGIIATLLLIGIVGSIMIQGVRLLRNWSLNGSRIVFFSYLVAFGCCILFNLSDVSIFDLRINTIGWILLSAISGVIDSKSSKIYYS